MWRPSRSTLSRGDGRGIFFSSSKPSLTLQAALQAAGVDEWGRWSREQTAEWYPGVLLTMPGC
jgi:hypothetical protein